MSQFLAPVLADSEEELERSLRPRTLADFVGQERVKEQLKISLEAAQARGEALHHVLLAGRRWTTCCSRGRRGLGRPRLPRSSGTSSGSASARLQAPASSARTSRR